MKIWGAVLLSLLLCSCSDEPQQPSVYDGAVVVRICVDGSHIYRLRDGRYIEGGLGAREVENPTTVCASK